MELDIIEYDASKYGGRTPTEDGIYHVGVEGNCNYNRVINSEPAWTIGIVDNIFTFIFQPSCVSSNPLLHQTNKDRVDKFNELISEHYPDDLESVLAIEATLNL